MSPSVAEFFQGTEIAEFFRRIIPVSMDIWIFFFLLPFALALIAQILLCFGHGRGWTRFLPLMLAGLICVLVFASLHLEFLGPIFGGFLGLILLGTAAFIAGGAVLGWIVRAAVYLIGKK